MRYYFESWSISKLLKLYQEDKLNLNPPYQRNDIWALPTKKKLIDTMKDGFPLPNFFLYLNENGIYEMVDGQQRTRTFLGYISGMFPDSNRILFKDDPNPNFILQEYQLIVVIITDISDIKQITDFYFKVNRFGMRINRPEGIRSERFDNALQNLIEKISGLTDFKELELFSATNEIRLLNQDFIGELLTLTYYGITDKKDHVDKLLDKFKEVNNELIDLEQKFMRILIRIKDLNDYFPIKETRYRQRNDFYTFFSFIKKHNEIDDRILQYMYEILVKVDPKISPSNEDCFAFQNYAINCVSQSNSKKARDGRLKLFEELLLNENNSYNADEENEFENSFHEIMCYYNLKNEELVQYGKYFLLPSIKL